jgi:acyl-CoA reductase-like NAD-dependent aldehyde dehydrogenase
MYYYSLRGAMMTITLKTYSPIDSSLYVQRDYADIQQINTALQLADSAQKTWKNTSLQERKKLCVKAVDAFLAQKEKIAEELCWQMGRPIRYAEGEVLSFADRANCMISIADDALAKIKVNDKPGFERYIKREPVGVVLVIAPWNYPLHTPINAIIPAILAGNTVILKHSSQTPLCAERIVEAFECAGFPKGVIQYLHMDHNNTELLIKSKNISGVAFTGSVAAGKKIEQAAAGRFIGIGLELGGKDPAYIRNDADIDYAVESTVDGAFFNSGQSCCGLERIYVHESIFDDYISKFVSLVKQYKLGRSDDPETTLGPLVRSSAAEFVRGQIVDAMKQGALPQIDSNSFSLNKEGTAYMAPQVLINVNHAMRVMNEESFGPVIGIMKVSSDEEAISLMNDSEFGLSAAIYSSNIEKAVELGDKIETGTFFVNRCDFLDPELAWTGVKNTGRGSTLSSQGFNAFTRLKSFHIKTDIL